MLFVLARERKKVTAVKLNFHINETPKYFLKHKIESFAP